MSFHPNNPDSNSVVELNLEDMSIFLEDKQTSGHILWFLHQRSNLPVWLYIAIYKESPVSVMGGNVIEN